MTAPTAVGVPAGPGSTVLDWYARHARELPWRAPDRTPWGVLVSEVMLQQTPVARVLPAWREWLARWPEPPDLAASSAGEAVRAWGRLGYPRRALRLYAAATELTERFGGVVPDDEEALRRLPGVGEYTAAAVAAFAFGRRAVVLDTNVRRVLARAEGGQEWPAGSPTRAERERAARLLPPDPTTSARWNVALMELGALVCTARRPDCGVCPLRRDCRWYAAGRPPGALVRRGQAWEGTDRQCRGRVLARLRALPEEAALSVEELVAGWPDPAQARRCLLSLEQDGLVQPAGAGGYRLPA